MLGNDVLRKGISHTGTTARPANGCSGAGADRCSSSPCMLRGLAIRRACAAHDVERGGETVL
jgi:hypothetical protein